MAKIAFYFLILIILMYSKESSADCLDFKKKCQTFCLAKSGGLVSNQCWGNPKYRFCKCDDMTVYHVPGYPCEHSTCPEEASSSSCGKLGRPHLACAIALTCREHIVVHVVFS